MKCKVLVLCCLLALVAGLVAGTIYAQSTDVTITSPTLSNGVWYANVRTKDVAGNWSSGVSSGPYLVFDPANGPPIETTLTLTASASSITTPNAVVLSGRVIGVETTGTKVTIQRLQDDKRQWITYTSTPAVAIDGAYKMTIKPTISAWYQTVFSTTYRYPYSAAVSKPVRVRVVGP